MELIQGFTIAAAWVWLIIAVVMGIIEAFTVGLATIWFAGGAVAAALVSLITDKVIVQILVFLVVSLVLLYFTRPVAVKKLNRTTVKTNVDAVIGSIAVAESDICKNAKGSVSADNKIWTAVLAEDSPEVSKGELVRIEGIEGVKLVVRKENRE
ncbi:MAG: NfeD family protein [Anaerovoracaceae bacterium]